MSYENQSSFSETEPANSVEQNASYSSYGEAFEPSAPVYQDQAPQRTKAPIIVAATLGAVVGALIVVVVAGLIFLGYYTKNNDARTVKQDATAVSTISNTKSGGDLSVGVAQKVLPSVVSISVKGIAQVDPITGQSYSSSGSGSGVLIKRDGYILTNNHVINGGNDIEVLVGNKTYKASVVGTDSTTDLAVIKITGNNFNAIKIGSSANLKVGQYVMALGSPFGLNNSVTTGIISALGRSNMVQESSQISTYVNLIQTDAAVNPGNSGGALVNEYGQLIGINTLISSTSGSSAGVGFAIPVDTAVDIANQLITKGKASHPFMGVSAQSIDEQVAATYKLPVSEGAYVVYVAPSSPAEKASLQRGDIITAINGKKISAAEDVYTTVREHKVGDKISVTYYRGDRKKTASMILVADTSVQTSSSQGQSQQNGMSQQGGAGTNQNSGSLGLGLTQ